MPNKKEISSFRMWYEQINLWPGQFSVIVLIIILMIPLSLGLLVLLPYFIQTINSIPADLSWTKFLGNEATHWIEPIIEGTHFENGIPLDFQKKWFAIILISVAFTYAILNYYSDSMLRKYGEKIAKKYRTEIAKKYLSLTYKSATNIDAGLLASMVGEDMREAQQSFTRLISSLLKDGMTSLIFIAWLILLDFRLFVLFLAILIPAAIVLRVTGKTLKRLSKQGLQFESELLSGLLERMRGWQTIQVYKAIPLEIINFNKINSKIYHVWRRATRARALGTPLVEWLGIIAGAFIVMTALRRISDGWLSSQILTGFMVTVGFLSDKINRMTSQLNTTRKGTDALHRIKNFLKTDFDSTMSFPGSAMSFPGLTGESTTVQHDTFDWHNIVFEFKNVAIGNNEEQILADNINLKLQAGSFVAIIGPSGVGKSTLIRTLLGVQKTLSGSLLLNGIEMNENIFQALSAFIGFIPQEPFLFSGSIFENIIYPKNITNPNPEELNSAKNALSHACLEKDLSESVTGLSGGEKQRLMFARIFFHQPKLIIIDEGTSALDLANELKVLDNLKLYTKNSITFIVAHRPVVKNYATDILDLSKHVK